MPTIGKRLLVRLGWSLFSLGFLSAVGYAQPWTVQTAAFRDLRQAETRVAELRRLGYDAYTEFALLDGRQYARVRVGCALQRAGAAALAQSLRRVTREAAVVPLSPETERELCVDFDLGFRAPERWGVSRRGSDAVHFWVEVGGQRGELVYNGAWSLQNSAEPLLEPSPGTAVTPETFGVSRARFAAEPNGDLSVTTSAGRFLVGRGELLWSSGGVAVARVGDEVVAVRMLRVPRADNP